MAALAHSQEGELMHAWRKYVQDYLDSHQIKAADLARDSGVSAQTLSNILTDDRLRLVHRPDQRTVDLLAKAMGVSSDVLLSKIGEAMGLPVSATVIVYDASQVSDRDLLIELGNRLRKAGDGDAQRAAPNTQAVGGPDGISEAVETLEPDQGEGDQPRERPHRGRRRSE